MSGSADVMSGLGLGLGIFLTLELGLEIWLEVVKQLRFILFLSVLLLEFSSCFHSSCTSATLLARETVHYGKKKKKLQINYSCCDICRCTQFFTLSQSCPLMDGTKYQNHRRCFW